MIIQNIYDICMHKTIYVYISNQILTSQLNQMAGCNVFFLEPRIHASPREQAANTPPQDTMLGRLAARRMALGATPNVGCCAKTQQSILLKKTWTSGLKSCSKSSQDLWDWYIYQYILCIYKNEYARSLGNFCLKTPTLYCEHQQKK